MMMATGPTEHTELLISKYVPHTVAFYNTIGILRRAVERRLWICICTQCVSYVVRGSVITTAQEVGEESLRITP